MKAEWYYDGPNPWEPPENFNPDIWYGFVYEITNLATNKKYIGKVLEVLVEKESKKSFKQWAGRTEGNTWVVFDKIKEKVGDIVDIKISDARGVTLFGQNLNQEYRYEVA